MGKRIQVLTCAAVACSLHVAVLVISCLTLEPLMLYALFCYSPVCTINQFFIEKKTDKPLLKQYRITARQSGFHLDV